MQIDDEYEEFLEGTRKIEKEISEAFGIACTVPAKKDETPMKHWSKAALWNMKKNLEVV